MSIKSPLSPLCQRGGKGYPLDNRGVTLVELSVVILIIAILVGLGVVSLTGGLLTASSKTKSNAEGLRLYLNYARIAAIGSQNPAVVAFKPADNFYYACIDGNANGECTASEQAALQLSKSASGTNNAGGAVNGVSLEYETAFGTFTQAGNPAHVAQKMLSGTLQRNSEGVYYMAAHALTDIPVGGMKTTGTSPSRFTFSRNGNAVGGSVYLYFKQDDDTSYHYAINVNTRGKVDLYQWALLDGSYRWKLISVR